MTFSGGEHGLGPLDFATIYSSTAFNSGISGAGVTIGVIGRSNLYSVNGLGEDVQAFRSFNIFNLCCGGLNIILNGPDPGDLGGGEEAEATLDTSWAGAVAPNATVDLVVSASTNSADGVDLSKIYIIENNLADVITESFSTCEAFSTSTEAAGESALAEQAAAQGMSYFVSSGDSGAEGCDDPSSELSATGPVSVNLLASSPFNVAVGGTVLDDGTQPSLYWSATNNGPESALSYIPEDAWNDSCPFSSCGDNANIFAGGGGSSIFFAKPSWQAGVTGIVNDNVRDLPDVSLTASVHDGYLLCLEASCVPDSQGNFFVYLVGGTSASTPSFAGIMSLVDQQMAMLNPAQGPRQGLANYVLYRLAASQNGSLTPCNGSNTSSLPASTCIFNDVTIGDIAVPGEVNYGLSTAQYQAGPGYDMATGLGSVNITNLVNQWNTVTFNPTTTTLTLSPLINITHGSSVNVNISVAPNTGTGHPSGDVSLLAFPVVGGRAVADFTLSGTGTVASSTSQLPGGNYDVVAHYAGDATYAASDSNQAFVTVTPEASTTTASALTADAQGNITPFTGGPFGSFVYLRADVAASSGHGTPTGSVTFGDTLGAIPGDNTFALNAGDQLNNGSNTATPNGIFNFDSGTHSISAAYSGDTSFSPSSTTASLTFTIQPGMFAAVPSNQSVVSISGPGASGSTSVSVFSSTGFNGTIALSCSGLPLGASCSFSPAPINAVGIATTTTSTITVTTRGAAAAARFPSRSIPPRWLAMVFFMCLSVVAAGTSGRKRSLAFVPALVLLLALAPACGGGGSKPPPPPPLNPTPTGVFSIGVTASSGSSTSTTGFTLIVN